MIQAMSKIWSKILNRTTGSLLLEFKDGWYIRVSGIICCAVNNA